MTKRMTEDEQKALRAGAAGLRAANVEKDKDKAKKDKDNAEQDLIKDLAKVLPPQRVEEKPVAASEGSLSVGLNSIEDQELLVKLKETIKPEHADLVLKDFDASLKEGQKPRKGNVLEFASMKEAENFFQDQAQKKRSFICQEQGKDSYFYSDGNGELFKGTKAELTAHLDKQKKFNIDTPPTPESSESSERPNMM